MSNSTKKPIKPVWGFFRREDEDFEYDISDSSDDFELGSVLYPMDVLEGVVEFGPNAFGWEAYASDGKTVVASGIEEDYNKAFYAMLAVFDSD